MNENIPVTFPGLHLSLPVHSTAFTIGSLEVKWYGILIAIGLLLAMWYAFKRCGDFGIKSDDLIDIVIFSLIFGVIGARLYYVIFYPQTYGSNPYFENPISILYIRDGGLGIYGGVIGALLAAVVVCKKKKISIPAVFDIAGLGFPIGQAIGRWGNFFNREAYGGATTAPWRMVGVNSSDMTTGYQPTFFFESVWLAIGFVLLHFYSKKHRKFKGEIFLMYVMWYGFERFFIEGLRTDSLMLGNFRVSQLVAAVSFFVALGIIVYKRKKLREAAREDAKEYTPLFSEAAEAVEKQRKELEGESDAQTEGDVPVEHAEPDAPKEEDEKKEE